MQEWTSLSFYAPQTQKNQTTFPRLKKCTCIMLKVNWSWLIYWVFYLCYFGYFLETKLVSSITSFFSDMLYPPILPFSFFQGESKCFVLLHCSSILLNFLNVSTSFPSLSKHWYIQNTDNVVFTQIYSQGVSCH